MTTKTQPLMFVGKFRTDADELLQTYTATVTVEVSSKAPKGFAEFVWEVQGTDPLDITEDIYGDLGAKWDGDSYHDIMDVLLDYPEYFDIVDAQSESVDDDEIDKVRLDDLAHVIFSQ